MNTAIRCVTWIVLPAMLPGLAMGQSEAQTSRETIGEDSPRTGLGPRANLWWLFSAEQIHQELDATDEQIARLRELADELSDRLRRAAPGPQTAPGPASANRVQCEKYTCAKSKTS